MIKKFYLKLLMGLLLVALAVPQVMADELTVGNGTNYDSYVPLYGSYMDESGTYSQTVYSSAMLSSLAGQKITQISYYPTAALSNNLKGDVVRISLKEVDQDGFTSKTPITDMTACGTCTIEGGESQLTFTLDNPFTYSGTKNLAIEVHMVSKGSGSGWASGMYWYYEITSGSVPVSLYHYSSTTESNNKIPKTTFTYESAGPKPEISATPATLTYETVVGTSKFSNVAVTGEDLTEGITATISGTNASYFAVTPETLGADGGTLKVDYNPTEAGNHTATLTLSSTGAQDVTIELNGTATAPAVPTLVVNPATVTINTEPNTTGTATFTVTGTNLTNDITLTASNGFTVTPTTIAAADAANGVTVTVAYPASNVGTFNGTITLRSNGATEKTVSITANVQEIVAEGTVTPTSLNFGEVLVGQTSAAQLVKVSNTGSDTFTPSFSIDNPAFSIDAPTAIVGGTSISYNVIFTPTAAGVQTGVLTVKFGGLTHTVTLTGQGKELAAYDITSSAASGVHNFGDAFVGGNATWNVTLTNNGANAVTPVIEGLAAPFSAENVPASIPAGQSATITIKFEPTEIKAYGPTSIVVKFNETEGYQFDYTLRGNGIEDTGTLPPSFYENIEYSWTDAQGNEHESKLTDIATDPDQMIALMREVYTNKNLPGPYYRGYKAEGTVDTDYPVVYPAIGTVTRFGAAGVDANYTYHDTFGWGIPHDQANYPFDVIYTSSSSTGNDYKALNANEYKPNTEGLTMLLVEMKDGATDATVSYDPENSSLRNIFDKMFKSVRVITNSKKVTKNGVDGTLFKIDCDKMNRFFFLGKGRLRILGNVLDDHRTGRSNVFIDRKKNISSSNSITNQISDKGPFYEMFEQFSPVSLIDGTESKDVYQQLINMQSYAVEHDCEYIPWATSEAVTGHEFNMYGKTSISDDCQDVRDLMFFVPDKRMMDWDERDKSNSDMFVNYYKQNAPTMGMYVIHQNEITGERNGQAESYTLHLSWESNLTDFVPGENGEYTIYLVNPDGTYTVVAQHIPSDQTTYNLTVNMAQHGQQVTYVIQGQDNTGFLSLQFSNEESFIIPGLDENEKFQMMPGAEYYSRFDPQTVHNFYANGMQVMAYPDATTSDYAGKTFNFYRKAAGDADWTLVGTAQVNTAGTEATVSMVEGTQRQQSEYKFGYKQNPTTVAVTTDANSNKVFGVIFDNFKADVSTNEHPSSYSYKMEVANTSLHSNEISIKVYKTQMRNLTGTFTEEYVENDEVRQDVDNSRQFDIDVEHSSKTEILRYGAYRWDSSYGTENNPYAVLNLNSDTEEDISPSGQASNQGEFYSVYMNGDSYIGDDVYVAQGETGQATFVDDVPATTNAAEEYTYAPVIETFTGRADYNTYGAPMQTTATGKIAVNVENAGKSGYTWEANGNTYRYYNVFVNVNTLDLPEGYEVAKIRAWRKIDASYLNEKLDAYAYRALLDANGEFMFDDPTNMPDNDKLGSEPLEGSSAQNEMYKGTFGALDVENGATVPMKFFVRIYFKKSNGSKAAGDEYYITEVEVDGELNNSIPTSIFGVESYKVVTGIKYYNLAGVESDVPFQGVNIEVTTYKDGSRTSRKIMK